MGVIGIALNKWLGHNISVMGQDIRPSIRTYSPALFHYKGGKKSLVPEILKDTGCICGNVIDPFFGSGAVPLALKFTGNLAGEIIGYEVDPNIINIYETCKRYPNEVFNAVKTMYDESPSRVINKERATAIRDRFNAGGNNIEQSARWLIISRHAHHGEIKYTKEGKIYSGMQEVRPTFAGTFTRWYANRLRDGINSVKDIVVRRAGRNTYIDAIRSAKPCDLLYLDPPYTGRKILYPGELEVGTWTPEMLDIMLEEAKRAADKGVIVVISESVAAEQKLSGIGAKIRRIKYPVGEAPEELVATLDPRNHMECKCECCEEL